MKRAKRLLQVVAALGLALGLAEIGFRYRDGGAFPHLRCYLPDDALGLRLEPGRVEKIRFGGADLTTVRINAEGLRGDPLPPPSADEVLVLGDSQAFGLGVEQDQTFSAVLASNLGRSVQNAGIPTYGPREYATMAERRLAARPAKTVVVLIAFQNDFFEANRSNAERHAAWDGWAVRKESAPASVTQFPGRSFVYRDSHLFYALRRALHGEAGAGVTRVASGGTLADFLPLSQDVALGQAAERKERLGLLHEQEAGVKAAQRGDGPDELASLVPDQDYGAKYIAQRALLRAATAQPGDIVHEGLGEGEENLSLTATASVIAEGAKLREQLAQRWWQEHHETIEASRSKVVALRQRLDALRAASNPITPALERIAASCKQRGARLVVVGLPTDTMVTPEAFAKYGEPPVDTAPIAYLADDLRVATEAIGGTWVDLMPTLQPLGLKGYLPKEFHLSVAGHAAVARRLAEVLARVELPRPHEVPVAFPFAELVCEGCSQDFEPGGVVDERGILHLQRMNVEGDYVPANVAYSRYRMLVDLQPGEELRGSSYGYTWRLWRAPEGAYHIRPTALPRSAEQLETCEEEAEAIGTVGYANGYRNDLPEEQLLGRGCADAVPGDILRQEHPSVSAELQEHVHACTAGDPAATPACRVGDVRLGPGATCHALCDAAHPCDDAGPPLPEGAAPLPAFRCEPFRGASVCVPRQRNNPTCWRPTPP